MSDLDYGYMGGDGRRCRRCKRRRLDDEPPEVRQYKTCAKCRIIEREKKKLKKPLTEETMIYGMKQFREDQQNPLYNNPHDYFDSISDKYADKYADKYPASSRATPAPVGTFVNQSQTELKSHHQLPASMSPGQGKFQVNTHAPVNLNFQQQFKYPNNIYVGESRSHTANNGSYGGKQLAYNLTLQQYIQPTQQQIPQQQQQFSNNNQVQKAHQIHHTTFQQQPQIQHGTEEPSQLSICCICSTKLNPSDEMCLSYSLCFECLVDPYEKELVFEEFGNFVSQIQNQRYKDLKVMYFIKEIDPQFVYDLAINGKTIGNEKQFRDFLLETLETIYLKVIIASSGYDFVQFKSNTSDIRTHQQLPLAHAQQAPNSEYFATQYKELNPIKSWYKCSKDLSAKCDSNLHLNYNPKLNLLFIKFAHRAHDLSIDYSKKLIDLILKIMDRLKNISVQSSNEDAAGADSSGTPSTEIGYNIATAYMVYDKLVSQKLFLPVEEQQLVDKLTKVDFVSDFLQFEKAISASEKKHQEMQDAVANGDASENKQEDVDEEEDEEEDDHEGDEEEDDDEDDEDEDEEEDDEDIEMTDARAEDAEAKPMRLETVKITEPGAPNTIIHRNGLVDSGLNGIIHSAHITVEPVKELDPTFGE